MNIPDWVQGVLSTFEGRREPYREVEIADALGAARKNRGDLNEEDWKAFIAEHSAFLFLGQRTKDSVWGTYFAPMMSAKKSDGSDFLAPDIKDLDAGTVSRWEERATTCPHPVVRARYADVVWDLKRAITGEQSSPNYARIAIDSYLEASNKKFYPMEVDGIQWLERALDLALSINDPGRRERLVEFMFEFYDRVAQAQFPGTWVFLFDDLWGTRFVTLEQESRIIANLEAMLTKVADTSSSEAGAHVTLDPWAAEAAAQRLAQHYRRQGDKPNRERVIKAYGRAFEHMATKASPMMAMSWLQPVIERYEQEGLKTEAEQLQIISAEKGKDISSDMKQYSVKAEVAEEDIKKLVEHLIGDGSLTTALARVADYFIPKANDARRLLEKMRNSAPLLSVIPISIIESDGHTRATIKSLDEDVEGRLHKQLADTIAFYQPFLVHTLAKLRERYTPKAEDVLGFLCLSSLFEGRQNELIRDGLLAYEREDFVKAIHVLVPQIEHVLRGFLGFLGRPTLKTVRNHPGIMDAKSMNDILGDERMREVLTENLWRYLTVVYIDKRGLNIRNNLAHGLIPSDGFSRHVTDRVFHTLLALSLLRVSKAE